MLDRNQALKPKKSKSRTIKKIPAYLQIFKMLKKYNTCGQNSTVKKDHQIGAVAK